MTDCFNCASCDFSNMNIKGRFTRNMVVALVATIAVAACLLFAYLTADDDSPIRESEPGDSVTYSQWVDGGCHTITVTLMAVDGDESTYAYYENGYYVFDIVKETGYLDSIMAPDVSSWTLTGKESIETSYGGGMCDVYVSDKGMTVWVSSDGVALKTSADGYVNVLTSSTLTDPEPPKTVSSRIDVHPGDYFAVSIGGIYDSDTYIYVVEDVDGEDLKVRIQHYTSDGGKERDYVKTLSLESFLDMYTRYDEITEIEPTGRIFILPIVMGLVECELYESDDANLYIGVDDGVCYRSDWNDGEKVWIIGFSLTGDVPDYIMGQGSEMTAGTEFAVSRQSYDLTESGMVPLDCLPFTVSTFRVDDVRGDMMDMTNASFPDVEVIKITDVEKEGLKAYTLVGYTIGSVKVEDTCQGPRLLLAATIGNGLEHDEINVDVLNGALILQASYHDGMFDLMYLSYDGTSEVERGPYSVYGGDYGVYKVKVDDGDGSERGFVATLQTFMSNSQIGIVYTDSEGGFRFGNNEDMLLYDQGRETITTMYGDVECDFMVLGHDGIRVTWWFSNFQAFAPKIVYEDGSMTATLEMIDDNVSKMLLK